MGISSLFESVKNWTVGQIDRTGSSSKQDQQKDERRFPNLGADIQEVVHTPEFEHVMNSASPFLLASLGAWPGYWLYRGLDYHSHRAHVPLPIYIRQTFYQAKMLQFVIIIAGIIYIVKDQGQSSDIFPLEHHDQ